MARRTNDAQVGHAIKALEGLLGGLDEVPVLVLGLTYRENVKELAYSRALPLIERLSFHGADVSAYDPLLSNDVIERCCATPYQWGQPAPFRAIVTQTADKLWQQIDFSLFPKLEAIVDGRNSLRDVGTAGGRPLRRRRGAGREQAVKGPRRESVKVGGGRRCVSSASSARGPS